MRLIVTLKEKANWKEWADRLRQKMMTSLMAEVTKSVDAIAAETATTIAEKTLRSVRFWEACQSGIAPHEVIAKAGFLVDFQPEEDRTVDEVTLRLNETWMTIMRRVLDRETA